MRVLITGGAGFIGSHTVREFVQQGHDVHVVHTYRFAYTPPIASKVISDRNYRFRVLLKGAEIHRGDMLNKVQLSNLIHELQPECVLHLASLAVVSTATRHPEEACDAILKGTINLLEVLSKEYAVKRFVYVSSSMVYGNFEASPVEENAPTKPINLYGGLKLGGEILTRSYLAATNLEYVIVRPCGVYGPTDGNHRVVQIFCESALARRTLKLLAGPDSIIDFTFVEDTAHGIYLACTQPGAAGEIFNIACGRGRELTEVIDAIRLLVPDVAFTRVRCGQSDRPRRGALDISKARKLIGYSPRWSLEDGVARYLNFMVQNEQEV